MTFLQKPQRLSIKFFLQLFLYQKIYFQSEKIQFLFNRFNIIIINDITEIVIFQVGKMPGYCFDPGIIWMRLPIALATEPFQIYKTNLLN